IQGALRPLELREAAFKGGEAVAFAAQQARARAAGAFAFDSGSHRRGDTRMVRQAQIVVRGHVDAGRRAQRPSQSLLLERSHPRIYATPERARRLWMLLHVRTRG